MTVQYIESEADGPPDALISAVFLLALEGERILSIRNERGWDIPGGHIAPGETPIAALIREVREEASATFDNAEPCCVITVPDRREVMLFFVTDRFELRPHAPGPDGIERDLVPIDVLLDRYYGPKSILRQIVSNAECALQRRARVSRSSNHDRSALS